jgi:hypothetical protein
MASEIFDIKAALKEYPEGDVAEHLAELHGINRKDYLKNGLTDAEFLSEYGNKTLPVSEPTITEATQLSPEALAVRNDPLNTALAGVIAGGAAGITSKGAKIAKALENLTADKMPIEPVAPTAPLKEYFAPGQKYMAKTGYGSGPGLTQEEVLAHQNAQEGPRGSGKITSKMKGPFSPDEILAAAAQREADDKMRARVFAQEKLLHDQAQAEYAAKQQEYLKQKNALAQEKKFALPNKLGTTKAVTGATLGYNAMDLANQIKQDDYGQAALAGTGIAGGVLPYIKKLPPKYRALGTGLSLLAPAVNRGVDVVEQKAIGGLAKVKKKKK